MNNKKINVAILQRAIPHYRLPLIKLLNTLPEINLTIITGPFDVKTTTGLPIEDYGNLQVKFIRIKNLNHNIILEEIISLKNIDVLIMGISINIITNPLYILKAKLNGVKVIGWGKGIPQNLEEKEPYLKVQYKKLIASFCDGLILYGHISKKYYEQLGLGNKPMFIAQNTIDTTQIAMKNDVDENKAKDKREALGLSSNYIFGYFGKLTKRKQVDQIVKAFSIVKKKYPNSVLIIAGDGPSTNSLKELAKHLNIENEVIFLGQIPIGEEGEIFHLFDAFLSFSQGGLGILEAMASKCLILSTPELYPETELLENNTNCLLCDNFTAESFANTMEKAIQLGEKKSEITQNSFNKVMQNATIEKMVKSFEIAIKKITNK